MIFLIFLTLLFVIFLNQGSLEELFVRHEVKFSTLRDDDSIADWLSDSGKHAPKSAYKDTAEKFAEPFEIADKATAETEVPGLETLRKQAKALSSEMRRNETIEIVDDRIKEVISEKIETIDVIEELEEVETRNIKGLKEEKTRKLKQLESRERVEVRIRLIEEVMADRDVSEAEAEKMVTREKLVTAELGEPRYLF